MLGYLHSWHELYAMPGYGAYAWLALSVVALPCLAMVWRSYYRLRVITHKLKKKYAKDT